MECFEHPGQAAVGLCRACMRGVCRACAVPLRLGLACRDRCEEDVRALASTLEHGISTARLSSQLVRQTPLIWIGIALVSIVVGVFVLGFGLSLPDYREIAFLGLPFLAIGALALTAVRRMRGDARRESPSRQ